MSDKEEIFSASEIESLSKNIFDTSNEEPEDNVPESVITGEPYELPEAYESSFSGVHGDETQHKGGQMLAYEIEAQERQSALNDLLTLDVKDGNSQDALNQFFGNGIEFCTEDLDEIDVEIERLKKSPGEMAELENKLAKTVKTNLAGVVTAEEEIAAIRGMLKDVQALVNRTNTRFSAFVKVYLDKN